MTERPKERSCLSTRLSFRNPEREIRLTILGPKLTHIWRNGGTVEQKKNVKPALWQPIAEL